jgi:hypothetical protein
VLGLALFQGAVAGLAWDEPAAASPADWRVDPAGTGPGGSNATRDITLVTAPEQPSPPPVDPHLVYPPLREWGNLDSSLDSPLALDLALPGFPPFVPGGHVPYPDTALRFLNPTAGASGGGGEGPPAPATGAPPPAGTDSPSLGLPPVPGPAPAAAQAPASSLTPPAGPGNGQPPGGEGPPAVPPAPIWVLDANNALVIGDGNVSWTGVTEHDFST